MITGSEIRNARKLLGWGLWRLAKQSHLTINLVALAEKTEPTPVVTAAHRTAIRTALETAGVDFAAAEGVTTPRLESSVRVIAATKAASALCRTIETEPGW